MSSTKQDYRTVFKTTSLFGGVQIVNIFVAIIKSKLVSVWLGATGFGILSLFNTIVGLISSIVHLGIQSSAVRSIASIKSDGEEKELYKLIKAINRLVIITSLIGLLLTILFSSLLSQWTFGNTAFTYSYILLSIVVFFTGIYNWYYAILQGMQQVKLLVKANVYGAILSLICSIPFFYFGRESGIVWALIFSSISTTLIAYVFVGKLKIPPVKQTYKESCKLGTSTIKLGIAMATTGISTMLIEFLVKTYISGRGGLADVGLYQAGWSLNISYLGIVFTAMAKDYFPRLSQIANDNSDIEKRVNQQGEISLLILTPLIVLMIFLLPLLIRILYSEDFLPIIEMTSWLLIGSLIKAGAWSISFVFLAKGHGKLFLINELGTHIITLPSYILGYFWGGLLGIGYAYCFSYTIYFIWLIYATNRYYKIKYHSDFWRLFAILLLMCIIYPITGSFLPRNINTIVGIIVCVFICIFSLKELEHRIKLFNFIRRKFK